MKTEIRVATSRMATSTISSARLPSRPSLNPAVPVIPLPDGAVQVGWSRRHRLSGTAATAVTAALPLLQQQRQLRRYDDQQRAGLAVLERCGALQSGHWPRDWAQHGDSDRTRLRGLANALRRTDAAAVVAARQQHPVWVSAPIGWGTLYRNLQQLNLAPATSASSASIAVVVGPTGFQQISSLMRNGTPHLAISARTSTIRVGPLVVPGRSACLQCLQLTRTERDKHFPLVSLRLENWAAVDRDPLLIDQAAGASARLVSRAVDATGNGSWGTSNDEDVPDDLRNLINQYWTMRADVPDTSVTPIARHPLCPCWWQPLPAAD